MNAELQNMIPKIVSALNAISTEKIYKSAGGRIQVRPKTGNDGNNWGVIKLTDVLQDMKNAIIKMDSALTAAKIKYIEFRQMTIQQEQKEIDAIAKEVQR